jgi:hypothetical protein
VTGRVGLGDPLQQQDLFGPLKRPQVGVVKSMTLTRPSSGKLIAKFSRGFEARGSDHKVLSRSIGEQSERRIDKRSSCSIL